MPPKRPTSASANRLAPRGDEERPTRGRRESPAPAALMRLPLTAEVRGAGRRGPVHESRDDERVQKFSADAPRAGALIPRGESESQNGASSLHQSFYQPMSAAVQVIFLFSFFFFLQCLVIMHQAT